MVYLTEMSSYFKEIERNKQINQVPHLHSPLSILYADVLNNLWTIEKEFLNKHLEWFAFILVWGFVDDFITQNLIIKFSWKLIQYYPVDDKKLCNLTLFF